LILFETAHVPDLARLVLVSRCDEVALGVPRERETVVLVTTEDLHYLATAHVEDLSLQAVAIDAQEVPIGGDLCGVYGVVELELVLYFHAV
jgi:hypothetical protein